MEGAEDIPLPNYAHLGDAGLDLRTRETVTLAPGEQKMISTGVSIELPEGYVSLVWDKSGLASKHGLTCLGGVIDAHYRGEYMVIMRNLGDEVYAFERGDKVAQLLIQKVERADIEVVNELSDTSRDAGGFGSTGKR